MRAYICLVAKGLVHAPFASSEIPPLSPSPVYDLRSRMIPRLLNDAAAPTMTHGRAHVRPNKAAEDGAEIGGMKLQITNRRKIRSPRRDEISKFYDRLVGLLAWGGLNL